MIAIYQAIKAGEYCSYLRGRAAERHELNRIRELNKTIDLLGDSMSGRHNAMLAEVAGRLYARYHPFSYGVSWETGKL